MSLARFLRLAEEIGESPLHAHTFVERLGAPFVARLRAIGLLVSSGFRGDYHCGGAHGEGCPRRIVDDPSAHNAVLALCGKARPACASIRLGRSDTEALSISRSAIEAALIDLFRVTPKSAKPAPFVTLGEHRKPRGKMRDVALVWGPWDVETTRILDLREGWGPRTLVLLPTLAEIPRAVLMRYRTVRRIEIAILSEMLSLEEGRLVLHAPKPLAPARLKSGKDRKRRPDPPPVLPAPLAFPPGLAWTDISFCLIDDDTLLLRVRDTERRIACFDIGMASRKTHKPRQDWEMLVRLCERRGWFTGKDKDDPDNTRISRFRDALQAAFGISDNPFFRYAWRQGWRARFGAHPEVPKRAARAPSTKPRTEGRSGG